MYNYCEILTLNKNQNSFNHQEFQSTEIKSNLLNHIEFVVILQSAGRYLLYFISLLLKPCYDHAIHSLHLYLPPPSSSCLSSSPALDVPPGHLPVQMRL